MAIQKSNVEVEFSQGLDTKTDDKLVLPGRLTTLENGVFAGGGTIEKRNGYEAFSTSILGTDSVIASGNALGLFNDELLLADGDSLYSWSAANDVWVDKGTVVPLSLTTLPIIRNTYQQTAGDSATGNGVSLYAWEDGRGGIRGTIIDEETGNPLLSDVSISATGTSPKCLFVSNTLMVFYMEGTTLYLRTIPAGSPTAFATAVTISSDLKASLPHFDVAVHGTKAVAAWSTSSSTVKVAFVLSTGTVGSPVVNLPAATSVATTAASCISVVVDPLTSDIWCASAEETNGLRVFALYADDFTVKRALTVIDSSTAIVNVTGVFAGASSIQWFYEVTAALSYNHLVKQRAHTTAGAFPAAATTFRRSVGLGSKAFLANSADGSSTGTVYVGLVYESTLQATYFIARGSDAFIMGKAQPGLAGGLTTSHLPAVNSTSDSEFFFASIERNRLITAFDTAGIPDSNTTFFLKGVSRTGMEFSGNSQYESAQLGDNLILAGGITSIYDGQSVVEAGFHLFPEDISVATIQASGVMAAGTRQACFLWEWQDNHGQIHRSAPSVPVEFTTSGINGYATFTVPTLRLTEKTGVRTSAMLAGFTTEAEGTVFYRTGNGAANPVTSPVYNDTTTDTVTFVRSVADTSIIANEILYTTGEILENSAPPASSMIAVSGNRCFLAGVAGQPNTVWYSKEYLPGEAVAFSEFLTITVDPAGGAITGLATMDDKLVVFKRDNILFMSGDGPSDLGPDGNGNGFTKPQLITTDVGCIGAQSITLVPQGLVFKSAKGIYLLSRGLEVAYIGAAVEFWNDYTITSAQLLEDQNQIRFLTEDGPALVYDYYFGQWGTFTNHSGKDSLNWNNHYVYLRDDGEVYVETPGYYKDDAIDIHLLIETVWLKFAGLQGFQRIYWASFLGNFYTDHFLKVSVAYDYQPFSQSTHQFDPTTALFSDVFGTGIFGVETPFGGIADDVYQFRVRMDKQKCQAIRFRVEDIGSNSGQSFSLSNLTLVVGIKQGSSKLGASKTIT